MGLNATETDETINGKWFNLLVFSGLSVLEAWVLFCGNLTFERWRDWLIVGGAFFFPIMALISAGNLARDRRLVGPLKTLVSSFMWLLALPFALIALAIVGWALFSIFGWFATIPTWAAVIILILLFKK